MRLLSLTHLCKHSFLFRHYNLKKKTPQVLQGRGLPTHIFKYSFFFRQYNLNAQYTYKYSKEEADAGPAPRAGVIKAGDIETGNYGKNVYTLATH